MEMAEKPLPGTPSGSQIPFSDFLPAFLNTPQSDIEKFLLFL